MPQTMLAYIGVGANLGDRVQTVIDARNKLASCSFVSALRSAPLYWSSPVGYDAQPAFINTVFELEVKASVNQLFERMRSIETELGRRRDSSNQNAARVIDLDLLLFSQQHVKTEDLQVPHPRMLQRRFVMEPLLALNPQLRINDERLLDRYRLEVRDNTYAGQEIFCLGGSLLS